MPVRKFRSIEEMNVPIWRKAGSPELYEVLRRVWQMGHRTSRRRYRPGVYRFGSIEEMQDAAAAIIVDPR
ncbi:MAG TPA: hypothetical protein VFL80_02840 [Thermoanaerobaculia bacterium]|nr:hypothetical protein [Thermoanaerobaculia bacterium]